MLFYYFSSYIHDSANWIWINTLEIEAIIYSRTNLTNKQITSQLQVKKLSTWSSFHWPPQRTINPLRDFNRMHQNVKAFGTYRENIVKRELVMNYEKEERYLFFWKIRVGIWNKNGWSLYNISGVEITSRPFTDDWWTGVLYQNSKRNFKHKIMHKRTLFFWIK